MTVTAHSKRRFHGSTEEPAPPACLDRDRFNLRMLEPWLYNDIPSSKLPKPQLVRRPQPKPQPKPPVVHVPRQPLAQRIRQWLTENGPATCPQIANGLGHKAPENVAQRLRDGIQGVVATGIRVPEKGKPVKIWGVIDNGESVST